MDWDAIGAIGQIVSAVAVIATLFYFARQMRQSTILGIQNESNAAMGHASAVRRMVASDGELAQIIAKSQSGEALSAAEQLRFAAWLGESVWNSFNAWHRARRGLSSVEWKTAYAPRLKTLLSNDAGAAWWAIARDGFDSGFRDAVEELISKRTD